MYDLLWKTRIKFKFKSLPSQVPLGVTKQGSGSVKRTYAIFLELGVRIERKSLVVLSPCLTSAP